MKTCPHCGQAVQLVGQDCPLCGQDVRRFSEVRENTVELSGSSPEEEDADTGIPENAEGITDSDEQHHLPEGLTADERFWAERYDEALEEAAG